jgi:hypothetical protein
MATIPITVNRRRSQMNRQAKAPGICRQPQKECGRTLHEVGDEIECRQGRRTVTVRRRGIDERQATEES